MRMDEIGYHHKHTPDFAINRPNGAGDWLFIIIKTKGFFTINGVEVAVKPNSFLLYTPEYPEFYRADPDEKEYIDDWMHFGPDEEEQVLMQQLKIPYNSPVCLDEITELSKIIRNMCHEQYSSHPYRKETVDLYFKLLVYKLAERIKKVSVISTFHESNYGEKLMWIRECIFRKPVEDWNINEIAKDLCLSRSRLQHLYTETFGVSITQDIAESRMQYACQLLKESDLSLEKIAELCKFSTTSYFIKKFKTAIGVTPNAYRKSQISNVQSDIQN